MPPPLPADDLVARCRRVGAGWLRNIVGRIHPAVEFGAVLAIVFGPFVWSQRLEEGPAPELVVDNTWFYGLVVYEILIGCVVLAFLRLRGHPLGAWVPRPSFEGTLYGVAL